MSIHLELADAVRQDALLQEIASGIRLAVRYAAADAYSPRWQRGDHWRGIDTAPCHPGLGTVPNHFHTSDGSVHDDPVIRQGAEPRDNLLRLQTALAEDMPALAAGRAQLDTSSRLTRLGGTSPASAATRLRAAKLAMPSRVARLALAM